MKTTKKIQCAPDDDILRQFECVLKKNGFLVIDANDDEKPATVRARAAEALRNEWTQKHFVRCAVWFVRTEDAMKMFVECAPSGDQIVSETAQHRRRYPNDFFESFSVMANIQAPMYGLAASIAGEFGISTDWKHDSELPMLLTVSKVVPMTEEEIAEAEAEAARKKAERVKKKAA